MAAEDQYLSIESLKEQVVALEHGEDLYMDVETFTNSLEIVDTVEEVEICIKNLPQQSKAKELIEAYADENIYERPIDAAGEWYEKIAKELNLQDETWYYGAIPREKAERLVLDQSCGRFLVRVSIKKSKQAYAITVSMGKLRFLHIAVAVASSGVSVEGQPFSDIRAAVNYFCKNSYKDIVTLQGPIITKALTKGESQAPAPPPRRSRPSLGDSDIAPPPPPRRNSQNLGASHFDFDSEHIYASTISDDEELYDEECLYVAPSAGQEQIYEAAKKNSKAPSRSESVKRQPLPLNVQMWTAGDVQRWLKDKALDAFKKPFYANGVDGTSLLSLSGSQFPSKRYSLEQRESLDTAIAELRKMHSPSRGAPAARRMSSSSIEEAPPPVPKRSGRPS